jgi:CxxC-x17-CxxC domain-containing protein
MSFQVKILSCCDCEREFNFSADEQESFQIKGFLNDPKRCPACRATRKSNRVGTIGNTINSYGNNNGYLSPRQMFPAVCSDCGKATQVPFEPRNGKPVYCSDCYRKVRVT